MLYIDVNVYIYIYKWLDVHIRICEMKLFAQGRSLSSHLTSLEVHFFEGNKPIDGIRAWLFQKGFGHSGAHSFVILIGVTMC